MSDLFKKKLYYKKEGDRTYVSAVPEGVEICDFCSAGKVAKFYPARDIMIDEEHASEGAWSACAPCAALIDANDRKGLFDRVMIQLSHQIGDNVNELADAIKLMQDTFFKAKI
jgi:hypothetical protein